MKEIEYIKSHPWLKKGYAKLRKDEIDIITEFFARQWVSFDDAMMACNRMFVDRPKTKNFTTVMELVSSAITHFHHQNGAR